MYRTITTLLVAALGVSATLPAIGSQRGSLEALDDASMAASHLSDVANGDSLDASEIEQQQRLLPGEYLPPQPDLQLPQNQLPPHDPGQFIRDLNAIINPH